MTEDKFEWKEGNIITALLLICIGITVYVFCQYIESFSDYAISIYAGFIGMFFALTLNNVMDKIRMRDRRKKLLVDIHGELVSNSDRLVGRGYILKTTVWDSGVSANLIELLDSDDLAKLSTLYHYFATSVYEAKICRQVGEDFASLPSDSSERAVTKQRWEKLSTLLRERESQIKTM